MDIVPDGRDVHNIRSACTNLSEGLQYAYKLFMIIIGIAPAILYMCSVVMSDAIYHQTRL